jgi:hypothetical protein
MAKCYPSCYRPGGQHRTHVLLIRRGPTSLEGIIIVKEHRLFIGSIYSKSLFVPRCLETGWRISEGVFVNIKTIAFVVILELYLTYQKINFDDVLKALLHRWLFHTFCKRMK